MISEQLVRSFTRVALSPDPDLAVAALMIARLEYPEPRRAALHRKLDTLGREAARRVAARRRRAGETPPASIPRPYARVTALNDYLFREQRFVGNDAHYEDPRNSFLNEVLDRRTGIPITLALVYMEVARRAGVDVEGVNFPGHFLVRCPTRPALPYSDDLIIDAFHGGALLSEDGCRELLRRHAGEGAVWDDRTCGPRDQAADPGADAAQSEARLRADVFVPAGPRHHRAAARRRSVGDPRAARSRAARVSAERLLGGAARPAGLPAARRRKAELDEDERSEHAQIWEHVKTLRRRVASLN